MLVHTHQMSPLQRVSIPILTNEVEQCTGWLVNIIHTWDDLIWEIQFKYLCGQTAGLTKTLKTDITVIWFVPGVYPLVIGQIP